MFNFENKRKMKKIVLVCIVAIMATAAQAQIYVGGTLGFSSVKTENSDAELKTTTIKLLPEIGYELDENWSIGTVVGYQYSKTGDLKTNTFTIAPYARYSLTLSKILCKWKQDSVVSLFLYLDSVFKNKHKLVHNQAPV